MQEQKAITGHRIVLAEQSGAKASHKIPVHET